MTRPSAAEQLGLACVFCAEEVTVRLVDRGDGYLRKVVEGHRKGCPRARQVMPSSRPDAG